MKTRLKFCCGWDIVFWMGKLQNEGFWEGRYKLCFAPQHNTSTLTAKMFGAKIFSENIFGEQMFGVFFIKSPKISVNNFGEKGF